MVSIRPYKHPSIALQVLFNIIKFKTIRPAKVPRFFRYIEKKLRISY